MPSEVNPETLDYLRMQLEDKVRANLEVSLFAHYRKLASSILFVLSFVGVAALWGLQTYLQTYIKDEVASRVTQEVEKQVQAPVREAVNEVNKQQKSIALTLMNTESRLEEASEDESRLGLKIVDIKGAISDAKAETKAIGEKMEDTADDVDANVTLMQLQNRGKLFASYGAVETLGQQLSALSNQVNSINKALNQLAQAVGKTNVISDAQNVSDAVAEIQKQAKTFGAASEDDPRTTVFVQFAKSTMRPQIVQLINKLNNKEFEIPGEQRVVAAEGKHEIRYFYKEDETVVKKLKAEIESAMSDLGYQHILIDPIPSLGSPAKPKRKVVELWLDLPKKK